MKHHYVYYSFEEFGRGYIGSRTSDVPPEEDLYVGSYRDKTFKPTQKIILFIADSRKKANEVEMKLQVFFSVVENPHFVNRSVQTSTSFSTEGLKMTDEWKVRRSNYARENFVFNRPELREANTLRMKENNPMKNPKTVEKVMRTRRTYEGIGNPRVKLTLDQCRKIRKLKATTTLKNSEIAEMFGVSVPTVKRVNRPDHWSTQ
jgi:DNA-binding transcriptional regulator YiaG